MGKELIQLRALPPVLASWSLVAWVQWETVLNAAERSSRMRAAVSPWSRRDQMSVVASRVVSMLWASKTLLCQCP